MCNHKKHIGLFVSGLQEKSRPDRATDRNRFALDGFRCLDSAVRTDAIGLRGGAGDVLSPCVKS